MKKIINVIIPLGVLALNCIIGGLIGGIIVFVRIIAIVYGDNKNISRILLDTMSKSVKKNNKKGIVISIITIPLLVIWNIFHNIFNPAVQYLT